VSDDLITWLRAQLDEDEAVANSATSGPWSNDDPLACDGVFAKAIDNFVVDCDYVRMGPFAVHNATHIARHDPARVLAEVEAKRRILDLHHGDWPYDPEDGPGDYSWTEQCQGCYKPAPCPTVCLLALPYADRPGYQEEWRP